MQLQGVDCAVFLPLFRLWAAFRPSSRRKGLQYGSLTYHGLLSAVCSSMQDDVQGTNLLPLLQGKLFIGGVEAGLISKDELIEYCSQW